MCGGVLRREAAGSEAEAEPAVVGDWVGWGGVDRTLKGAEGRPLGTQCSQETAVPVVNPGPSPPTDFLILNCLASVLAPSPHGAGGETGPCEGLPCGTGCRTPTLTPWGAGAVPTVQRLSPTP